MTPYPTEVGLMKRFSDLVNKNLKGVGGKMNSIKTKAKELGAKVGALVRVSHLFAKGKEAKQKVGKQICQTAKELQKLVKNMLLQGRQLRGKSGVELQRLSDLMDRLLPQILHFLKTGFVATGKIIHLQMPELYAIVRGKAGKSVEFGIKWGVNLVDGFAQGFVMGKNASDQKFCIQAITPISPPSSLRHLLRRGYEGQEGFYRQAGLAQRLFQEPPAKSKFLAVSQ